MRVPRTLCVILRKPPYGSLDAAEAIRHLSGALTNGLCPVGLLVDDGVYLAKAGHQAAGGWTDLSGALGDLLAQTATDLDGGVRRATLYVHGPSLTTRGLDAADLLPGCHLVDETEAAAVVGRANATLVY